MAKHVNDIETLFPEIKDPAIVKAADRVVELRKIEKDAKKRLEVQEKNLIGMMKKLGKAKIRHGGMMFEVKETPGKQKLKVKVEKEKSAGVPRGGRRGSKGEVE